MLRHYMKDRGLVMGRVDRTQVNPKDLGKPRVRRGANKVRSVQDDRGRLRQLKTERGNSAAEVRPVRSRQATAVSPCPYYIRSRLKKPEGIPEEQRSNGINRRATSGEGALDGDPVDRSE
ncbi:hypothetical protein TNCV_1197381 [Trichonephila clavipes]|uniref:Uncharacterized protein n=1 Tax=Trichonephila clavipes TaxID=2585209 RepID=A0A8X6RZC0_TRICX|nr:hypothetical protein TNCV_1197381 [Trichonephila clavipes]